MGYTEFFGISYFDFGDELDSPLSVQKEIDRFTLIDRQLYGMASIFDDGVISGWNVEVISGLSVNISAGVGIISKFVVESDFPDRIDNLPTNETVFIYASPAPTSLEDRTVDFIASTVTLQGKLLLATVVTGGTDIVSIDNTVKQTTGVSGIVSDTIAHHRHGGVCICGSSSSDTSQINSPKIDLTQEVQGKLPNDMISDIDASKIVGGKLPENVMPLVDHTNLRNIGSLTHPQLDSIAKSIQSDNIALLGEVASINLMKMIIFNKYLDVNVDKYFVNELAIIPGVTDSNIDYVATTANVDTVENCISGIPASPLQLDSSSSSGGNVYTNYSLLSTSWTEDADFRLAVAKDNLAINSGVRLSVDTISDKTIETFEGVQGQTIATYTPTINEVNTTSVIYSRPAVEGDTAAMFETVNSRNAEFNRTFSTPQDWSSYDTINVWVKSFGTDHAAVNMAILDSSGNTLQTFVLLAQDEVTYDTSSGPTVVDFVKKEFSISSFTRNEVGSIKIYTDNITNSTEAFYIDTIFLQTSTYLLSQGNMKLRFNTTAPVVFSSIVYNVDVPVGTNFTVRAKIASSLADLADPAIPYTSLLSSGEPMDPASSIGSYVEIDIAFYSDSGKTKTPTLTGVWLNMLVPSTTSGLSIETAEQWNTGTLRNINVSNAGVVSMKNTNVGDLYFVRNDIVNELAPLPSSSSSGDISYVPTIGISAANMPVAPSQGNVILNPPPDDDPYITYRRDIRGLYGSKSAYRLNTGNFLIADTGNDRVLEMTQDGDFVRGYASHNYDYDSELLYAMTANYNSRLGVLFITFSKLFDIQNIDLRTIKITVGNSTMTLSNQSDKVRSLVGEIITDRDVENANAVVTTGLLDRTLSVLLSIDKRDILDNTTFPVTVHVLTNTTTTLECFMGDYMYFGAFGICNPVYANETKDGDRIIIANAAVTHGSETLFVTPAMIEFQKNIGDFVDGSSTPVGLTFAYSGAYFSDIMIGSLNVYETTTDDGQTERKILIAGLDNYDTSSLSSSSSGGSSSSSSGHTDSEKLSLFSGVVKLVDMDSQLTTFKYISPDGLYPSDAYIDDYGYIVVAESSFITQSGRIITLDPTGISDGQVPPIIRLIEGGVYTKIWDIRPLNNDHILVST